MAIRAINLVEEAGGVPVIVVAVAGRHLFACQVAFAVVVVSRRAAAEKLAGAAVVAVFLIFAAEQIAHRVGHPEVPFQVGVGGARQVADRVVLELEGGHPASDADLFETVVEAPVVATLVVLVVADVNRLRRRATQSVALGFGAHATG